MQFSYLEFVAVFHGMIIGAVYLLAFAAGGMALWDLRTCYSCDRTPGHINALTRRLIICLWVMTAIAWATMATGLYAYIFYRLGDPESPRSILLASAERAQWHTFGMEWKEHVAWMAPILATAVAFVVMRYGLRLADDPHLRRACIILFTIAFLAAAVAGVFGAFITKAAPIY